MGNSNQKAIELAIIIKRQNNIPYDKFDYSKFFSNKKLIAPSEYENFQDFIEKQSLKTLRHILIVEGSSKSKQSSSDNTSANSYGVADYMVPIKKALRKEQKEQLSIRDKIINYIKKYSLENLNLYFYVANLKDFMVPEAQVPYVTLVSSKASTIINHILNQQSEKMVNVKFKGLMKDIFRRKLVAVISKDWKEKLQVQFDKDKKKDKNQTDKKQKPQQKPLEKQTKNSKPTNQQKDIKPTNQPKGQSKEPEQLNEQQKKQLAQIQKKQKYLKIMLSEFTSHKNQFQYLFVNSIDKFREKLKSMYFEFVICMDKQNLLELIEFKQKMPVDSKLIYFGNKKDLSENLVEGELDTTAGNIILEKKLNQIWWISDKIEEEICPVMKKWWNLKQETRNNSKKATNVVIYLCKTENIVRKKEIQDLIKLEIESLGEKKLNQKQQVLTLWQTMNLTIEFKLDSISQRFYQSLYTNLIMFDATNQEYEEMKKFAFNRFKGEPRLQVSLVECKSKPNTPGEFQQRIKNCISKLQLKFEYSPIENIRCINIQDEDVEYFKNKMGLKVDVMNAGAPNQKQITKDSVKRFLKSFEQYFPRFASEKNNKKSQFNGELAKKLPSNGSKFTISSTFDNFLVVCSFQDYLRYLFPFFVMANFFKEKFIFETKTTQGKLMFDILSEKDFNNISSYLEKIKVIINGEIDFSGKKQSQIYDFNKMLKIHESQHDAISCIKEALYEYLQVPYIKNSGIELNIVKKREDSPQKNKKVEDPKQKEKKQLKEKQISKFVDWVKQKVIQTKNPKNKGKKDEEDEAKVVFPNIVFAHYKISEIEEYINFYKYTKLSISHFPKDTLKNFYLMNEKIDTILTSRSFSLDGTFLTGNNLLKDVFEKKNIQVSLKHKMDFVRFSSNRISEVGIFEDYVKKYAGLWKLKFELFRKDRQSKILGETDSEAFKLLKNDVKRAFQKCKNYELLKITTSEFKHFYLDRIQKCETLLDLQITAIYIYSLPHGFSQIISVIFEDPIKSALSIEIFGSFLFLLFANFYSLESRTLQKVSTVIYVSEEKIKNIYHTLRENEIIINKNILHILNSDNETENEINHCVFIDYENVPWQKRSSLTTILKIENFAFYKESAQFILAPFTKLKLREKKIVNNKFYKLYFDVIADYDSNIFLKTFFELNDITDLTIFRNLDQKERRKDNPQKPNDMEDKQDAERQEGAGNELQIFARLFPNPLKEQKKLLPNSLSNALTKGKTQQQAVNSKKPRKKETTQTEEYSSLYRQAQQVSLKQQKQSVRKSIRLILSYMNMLYSMKKNHMFSAERYFYEIYFNMLNELDDNENDNYEEIKEEMELEKLRIEKALLYAKMNDFSKAIAQLEGLLDFFQYEKVEEYARGGWMKAKVVEMKNYIINMRKLRHVEIDKIKQVKKWNISMEGQTEQNSQNTVVKTFVQNPKCKWTVKYYDQQQNFIMQNTNNMIEPNKYKVFGRFSNPEVPSAQKTQKNQNKKRSESIKQPTFALGDLLFELFSPEVKEINELDLRGKGISIEQNVNRMNEFFDAMVKTKSLKLIKLIHMYVKFWGLVVKKVQDNREIWKKMNDIPQMYILDAFLELAENVYFDFKPKKINDQAPKPEEQFKQYIMTLQDFFTPQTISQIRQGLLEEYLEKEERTKKPKISFIGQSMTQKCWIDEQLCLREQRKDWSVFEFDGRMVAVDAKRKFKQNIVGGLNVSGKTFVRANNDVINFDKNKKSKITTGKVEQ